MTDTTAAQRVQAYLDARQQLNGRGARLSGQIAEAKNAGQPWARLTAPDLQAVLDELDAAESSSDRAATEWHDLTAECEEARAVARMFIAYTGAPCARWLRARAGHEGANNLPDWLTADDPRDDDGHET